MPEVVQLPDVSAVDLESLATDVVKLAMKAGASDAEAVVREGDEFSVNVRLGQVETLKESGSRAIGLRVFVGKQSASASTSDLTADGIRQLVEGAMALAKVTEEDPFIGLPETEEFGAIADDLHLYFDDVYSLPGPERIEWARRCVRRRPWRRTRASRIPMGEVLTLLPAGRFKRTRGDLSGAIARVMREYRRLRWRRMKTGRCSGMDGGRARGGWANLRIS